MPKRGESGSWRESMKAQINSLPTAASASRPEAVDIRLDVLPGAYGAILQAASARRVTVASFMRRAALAMAAHDLEIPLRELVERDPRMARDINMGVDDPTGRRFGAWEIAELYPEFQ